MDATVGTLDQEVNSPMGIAANARLAELVLHLSDCPPPAAVAAVAAASGDVAATTGDERLAIVAQALVSLRHGIDLRDRPKAPQPQK